METKIWKLDPTHSNIGFSIKHMMFTNVKGNFKEYEGTVVVNDTDYEHAQLNFTAQIDSINTNNADRDNHLKSADFFDASKYPTLQFESTSLDKKDAHNFTLNGTLTMHGTSKPIALDAEFSTPMKDPFGNTKIGLNITGKINRKDWNLNWNSTLETGGLLVGEDVKFDIEIQLV